MAEPASNVAAIGGRNAAIRVAIDARAGVQPGRTGVGHYVEQVTRHLPAAAPDLRFVAWYAQLRGLVPRRRYFDDVEAANLVERATRVPRRLHGQVTARLGVPLLDWFVDADVVFAPNYFPPPFRRGTLVVVVHDLAFDLFPETAPHVDERWRTLLKRGLRRAEAIVVPSRATAADLSALHDVDPARVTVVPHGVNADAIRAVPPAAADATRRRLGIEGRLVVFLGGIEPRKNLPRLVRAFASIPADATLVIAGAPVPWYPQEAESLRSLVAELPEDVRDRIMTIGYVGGTEKRALLAAADVLAYPSLYEGFGFPVLEAMAARVPVLTSNVSSIPEVAGDAAYLVDPEDESQIARGLNELLEDPDLRDRLIGAGLARAARFTWHETARRTAAVLREAAEHRR